MHITALSFAIGTLIVSAISKACPDAWLNKMPMAVDEQTLGEEEGTDLLSRMHKAVANKVEKSA